MGDVDFDDLAKEGGTAKASANFLIASAQLSPAFLLPHISYLSGHLEGEVE